MIYGVLGSVVAATVAAAKAPVRMAKIGYHMSFHFLLADQTFGLHNFVNDEVKPMVLAVANLHNRAAHGEDISEEEWSQLQGDADKVISNKLADASSEPTQKILQAATGPGSLGAVKSAGEFLVVVITMACSQSVPTAAASAVTAIIPGGKFTQDAIRRIIFDKLTTFLK